MSASNGAIEPPRVGNSNTVFKSGHLLVSWKGLGWIIWKKRWFILTRTSLVFFKNDPSALPQSDGEANLTLGGIDLNNSGSVVVREDKKLLTVLFPDVRDGRAFTLKAETSEDLLEWKTALENALAQAPNASLVMGQNEIFRSDTNDSTEGSFHKNPDKSDGMYFHLGREKRPVKSLVIGRPILLALEDIDGGPSFLEKALQFLEKYGVKVEGILRQSADVEEVDKRVQEYEQGKTKFYPSEDPHVIGDCVKHVLRELPSSPVPAACCTAMLEAFKIDSVEARVTAMRTVIQEAFPEPNRHLLQRVLKMMRNISSNASENRMTQSVVSVCMAPLLLRPLVAGECELEDDYDTNGDDSSQILAAASAANNAQAIITFLLEHYENIFDDDFLRRFSMSVDSQTDNGSENSSDDQNPNRKINGYRDTHNDFDSDRRHSGRLSGSSGSFASDLYDYKATINDDLYSVSPTQNRPLEKSSNPTLDPRACNESVISVNGQLNPRGDMTKLLRNESQRSVGKILSSMNQELYLSVPVPELLADKALPKPIGTNTTKKSTFWRKKNARKTPSTESIDFSGEEELAIQRLETAKNDLRQRIAKEARGNAILQASLERRKQALHERRMALEQDVARLQEQLQAERDLRAALEVGLSMSPGQFSSSRGMDSKTRGKLEEIALAEADVARLKQKVAELHHQLNQQRQHQYQHPPNQSSQQKYFQTDFDTTPAVCNNEGKQRTEGSSVAELRIIKGQLSTSGTNSRLPSISDSISTEASTSLSPMDDAVDSISTEAMDNDNPRHQTTASSSTLVELTNRLDFFRERRSQLLDQLNIPYHEFLHKPSSPP